MNKHKYLVEAEMPFSKSLIWQLNREYYNSNGLEAWRSGEVPHNLTSSSMVGMTYAKLIFGMLKDISHHNPNNSKVYILELGAGHGRLAFHVLKHLEILTSQAGLNLPSYCYVLSDIVEANLSFFINHPQFQSYLANGLLDVCYFDGTVSNSLELRYAGLKIGRSDLDQPLVVIANYFFDTIPNELIHISNGAAKMCTLSLTSEIDPLEMEASKLLPQLHLEYFDRELDTSFTEDELVASILSDYVDTLTDTYLFFPKSAMQCIMNLRQLGNQGLMLLSMDKGFHELYELDHLLLPDMVTHGSMSFWVNYHAIGQYCEKQNGLAMFSSFSSFHVELGCFLFMDESGKYNETIAAFERSVNDFGPDEFQDLQKFTYKHMDTLSVKELISMLRLGFYDSTFFINLLPRISELALKFSIAERNRLSQTLHATWNLYFSIGESHDLAFEIGGLFYQLAMYEDALHYFFESEKAFVTKPDLLYNKALCYYQLRYDHQFLDTLERAKALFPDFERWGQLAALDLNAK